jgi:hypothetical protein
MVTAHRFHRSRRGLPLPTLAALALFLLFSADAFAQSRAGGKVPLTVSGEFNLWLPEMNGEMLVDTETVPGTNIRLDRHLDLEEHPEVFEFGLTLGDVRYGQLAASFLRFTAPGNKVLTRDLVYGGISFDIPETVHTDFAVELDRVSVSYIQDVRGAYILTYEVGMAFFRWKSKISNRHVGKSASEDASTTLPLTGLHAIFPMGDAFRFTLGFTGVFFQTTDDDVNLVETYGELSIAVARYLIVGFGYRHFSIDGELELNGSKTANLEFSLRGVYFSVGIKI